jgi:hypothetical protein
MARPIVWPQVARPSEPAAPDPTATLDNAAISAAFGPELTRLMGIRISARPDPGLVPPRDPVGLGRIRLGGGPGGKKGPAAVEIHCSADGAAVLLERLFGARAAEAASASGADLMRLPPGCASWIALCRTVAAAATRALAAGGLPPGGAPQLPARPQAAALLPGAALLLDVDGAPCALMLCPDVPPPPLPTAETAPDAAVWRRQARARALDLELPVSLRIAQTRMAVSRVAGLVEGDILPLDRPATLDVMAGGRRVARLPASSFIPPARADDNPNDGGDSQ